MLTKSFWGILIGWFIKLSVQNFQLLVILCVNIGYVHQFIGHCLIPLDSWYATLNIRVFLSYLLSAKDIEN